MLRVFAIGISLAAASGALAASDLRRIEAVGVVGVGENDRRDPRAAAVQRALREAVERVATEYLVDSIWPVDAEDPDDRDSRLSARDGPDLAKILGKDMGAYTARFKVLEDRGVGPALLVEDLDVTEEYVVVAEVFVEADRVRERLVAAGLLEEQVDVGSTPVVQLVVQGLLVYPAFVDVRELITGPVGAESAVPVSFERGRATLAVATAMTAKQLVAAMEREAPPHLTVIRLGAIGAEPRIAVRWSPRPEEAELPPVEAGGPEWWKRGTSRGTRD